MKYIGIFFMLMVVTAQAGVFGSEKVPAGTISPEKDYDTVNGSITVGEKAHVDDLDTVNGSIKVGLQATVGQVETVNGSIKFEDGVTAEHAETVNGSIVLGSNCTINGHAETVNGAITAGAGCVIDGDLETVNGKITAIGTRVEGGIETVNGNITLDQGTIIDGDVVIEKSSGWFNSNNKVPEVYIGKNVVLKGDLVFKKKVKLKIDDSAKVGDIIGQEFVENID